MMFSSVVSDLPSSIDNRSFSDLNYAVTSEKSDGGGRLYQINVSPLQPVIVDVVSDFTEQYALVLKNTIRFLDEWRKRV